MCKRRVGKASRFTYGQGKAGRFTSRRRSTELAEVLVPFAYTSSGP
jgi:hypothetical protein